MSSHLKAFATVDPNNLSSSDKGFNLVAGEWKSSKETIDLIDPINGSIMMKLPNTQLDEI
jgi:hypothetical protein